MKKAMMLCVLFVCLTLPACNTSDQNNTNPSSQLNQALLSPATDSNDLQSDKISGSVYTDKETYIEVYTDFLLDINIDADNDTGFPIQGYYLFDLDYDDVPELGVLHNSLGSMGGYFTYYRIDGDEIVPIMDNKNSPARHSNYTQILADVVNKKVYFLKEMYLLQGNENGKYGYLRELVLQNSTPYVYSVLELEVDEESDLRKQYGKEYYDEDEFLSDTGLDECLITRCYSGGEGKDVSSAEYLRLKRELIPTDNIFMDLRDTDICYIGTEEDMWDELNGVLKNILLTSEEINTLFSKWLKYIRIG